MSEEEIHRVLARYSPPLTVDQVSQIAAEIAKLIPLKSPVVTRASETNQSAKNRSQKGKMND